MGTDKKRREPKEVPPVQAGGRVYAAPHDGVPLGYAQDGGIVAARDADTGALLWSQRVYDVLYGGDIESDKQEVFITRLTLSADGQALDVDNERGETYRLGLMDRSVERVTGKA
jgi:outer membrane protein assembly factor BamB